MTIQLFYLFKCDEVIIGGDYYLVLDVEKDKKGGLAKTHKKPLEVINSYTRPNRPNRSFSLSRNKKEEEAKKMKCYKRLTYN